jgi:hypothetical protein
MFTWERVSSNAGDRLSNLSARRFCKSGTFRAHESYLGISMSGPAASPRICSLVIFIVWTSEPLCAALGRIQVFFLFSTWITSISIPYYNWSA